MFTSWCSGQGLDLNRKHPCMYRVRELDLKAGERSIEIEAGYQSLDLHAYQAAYSDPSSSSLFTSSCCTGFHFTGVYQRSRDLCHKSNDQRHSRSCIFTCSSVELLLLVFTVADMNRIGWPRKAPPNRTLPRTFPRSNDKSL